MRVGDLLQQRFVGVKRSLRRRDVEGHDSLRFAARGGEIVLDDEQIDMVVDVDGQERVRPAGGHVQSPHRRCRSAEGAGIDERRRMRIERCSIR